MATSTLSLLSTTQRDRVKIGLYKQLLKDISILHIKGHCHFAHFKWKELGSIVRRDIHLFCSNEMHMVSMLGLTIEMAPTVGLDLAFEALKMLRRADMDVCERLLWMFASISFPWTNPRAHSFLTAFYESTLGFLQSNAFPLLAVITPYSNLYRDSQLLIIKSSQWLHLVIDKIQCDKNDDTMTKEQNIKIWSVLVQCFPLEIPRDIKLLNRLLAVITPYFYTNPVHAYQYFEKLIFVLSVNNLESLTTKQFMATLKKLFEFGLSTPQFGFTEQMACLKTWFYTVRMFAKHNILFPDPFKTIGEPLFIIAKTHKRLSQTINTFMAEILPQSRRGTKRKLDTKQEPPAKRICCRVRVFFPQLIGFVASIDKLLDLLPRKVKLLTEALPFRTIDDLARCDDDRVKEYLLDAKTKNEGKKPNSIDLSIEYEINEIKRTLKQLIPMYKKEVSKYKQSY
eukprot:75995_1